MVSLHTLSKAALAVMFVVKRLLVEDLARTAALGNAMFVGEIVEFRGGLHD